MPRGCGTVQQKVLLLLMGGLALGLSGSPKVYFQVLRGISEDWDEINKQSLKRAIKKLYESKLIEERPNSDGTYTLILSESGKKKALTYRIDEMKIKKPEKWDGKWRVVLFDIPDNRKKARDVLRRHLRNLEFYEFQESVFVHPYDCKDEIDYFVEFYDIRRFVRFIEAGFIDNESYLRNHFDLL